MDFRPRYLSIGKVSLGAVIHSWFLPPGEIVWGVGYPRLQRDKGSCKLGLGHHILDCIIRSSFRAAISASAVSPLVW